MKSFRRYHISIKTDQAELVPRFKSKHREKVLIINFFGVAKPSVTNDC